ncbi:MAG: AAA family ATPase [Bifidobacteriaceae bacterium]|nr:AAA family ATPase [Bifidobacteriaceae bacterium]
MDAKAEQLRGEQQRIDALYARLDELKQDAATRLDRVRRAGPSGSPQNRSERDSFATHHADRLALFEAVEDRLCFGRLDYTEEAGGETRYIGRIGLATPDQTQLLTDWRAPAAEPFYQATAAHPLGVTRRRHIQTRRRAVIGLEDELFDLDHVSKAAAQTLSGEGALLAAIAAERTGHMHDIVSTIQAEQDRVIRSDLARPLVVEGGPGTGKTAVALHRAAYLLYTYRGRLASAGVLLVGPSRLFLRYIDQVLPSLGENGVVTTTLGDILPGFRATAIDAPAAARAKGRRVWQQILRRAVRQRQRLPRTNQEVRVQGHVLTLRRRDLQAAEAQARATRKPYNAARVVFVRRVIEQLTDQLAQAVKAEQHHIERATLAEDVRTARDVRVALNLCWMPLTPTKLLEDLFAKPLLLRAAAPELSEAERRAVARPAGAPWTVSDVPLIDEAAELLGHDDEAGRRERARRHRIRDRERDYAGAVLENQGAGYAQWMLTADQLADRWIGTGPHLSAAERAAQDRTWTYGHIVVDEAQELSEMDWRMLLRRCPTRSFTIVGDPGQTHSAAGARDWAEAFDTLFGAGRWQRERLTVNYRTPASIMALAEASARAAGVPILPTTSARDVPEAALEVSGPDPVALAVAQVVDLLRRGSHAAGPAASDASPTARYGGRLAVIAPAADGAALRAGLERAGIARVGTAETVLDESVSVLTPAEAKGLEFDDVVVVRPEILGAGPAGPRDLYVAETRATQHLRLIGAADQAD